MVVHAPRAREWGGVVWAVAAVAFLIGGIPESLMTGRNRRVQHQGTRNSTEAVLQPIAGTPNATEELRRVLQKAPDVGPVAVVYSKDFVHLSEPAMALSILAWPMETCVIPWDGSEGAWRRFAAARDGRRIFVGPAMAIPGYRFEPLGPQLWSVVKEEAR